MSEATAVVRVSADGNDWRDISPTVRAIDVEDHERLTDKATVVLDDPTELLAHAGLEGLELRVTLGWGTDVATIFEGEITGSRVIAQTRGQRLELTVLDFSHRLTRRTSESPRAGERISAYLRRIVVDGGHDIAAAQIAPANDREATADERLRPPNMNDLEFIQRLAEQQVCRSFVEFDGIGSTKFYFVPLATLVSAEPLGELRFCRGVGELIEFDYERISSGATTDRSASAVDAVSGEVVNRQSAPSPPRPPLPPPGTGDNRNLTANQRQSIEALSELAAAASARLQPRQERVTGRSSDPATAAGAVEPDPTRRLGYLGRGTATGHHRIRAKGRVRITGIAPWAQGEWYLVKVNHVYTRERISNRDSSSYFTKIRVTR